ncbi:hypothetical protein PL336_11770 [Sulfitobacter faviae]|uniref:Uncharacterized protein n=1 Tax=Sulfitobacter faviae TaxID=1775881 RepID=A0AAX3LM55_9RHOB|nr:hypothetical protein [Sulfitobacter faviae]WCE69477.1 hypothetical protein PL336_11770 [Sulfitobacter faviae]
MQRIVWRFDAAGRRERKRALGYAGEKRVFNMSVRPSAVLHGVRVVVWAMCRVRNRLRVKKTITHPSRNGGSAWVV